jgi:hypothetical protein
MKSKFLTIIVLLIFISTSFSNVIACSDENGWSECSASQIEDNWDKIQHKSVEHFKQLETPDPSKFSDLDEDQQEKYFSDPSNVKKCIECAHGYFSKEGAVSDNYDAAKEYFGDSNNIGRNLNNEEEYFRNTNTDLGNHPEASDKFLKRVTGTNIDFNVPKGTSYGRYSSTKYRQMPTLKVSYKGNDGTERTKWLSLTNSEDPGSIPPGSDTVSYNEETNNFVFEPRKISVNAENMQMNQDGSITLVSGATIVDPQTGSQINTIEENSNIKFNDDGSIVITGESNGEVFEQRYRFTNFEGKLFLGEQTSSSTNSELSIDNSHFLQGRFIISQDNQGDLSHISLLNYENDQGDMINSVYSDQKGYAKGSVNINFENGAWAQVESMDETGEINYGPKTESGSRAHSLKGAFLAKLDPKNNFNKGESIYLTDGMSLDENGDKRFIFSHIDLGIDIGSGKGINGEYIDHATDIKVSSANDNQALRSHFSNINKNKLRDRLRSFGKLYDNNYHPESNKRFYDEYFPDPQLSELRSAVVKMYSNSDYELDPVTARTIMDIIKGDSNDIVTNPEFREKKIIFGDFDTREINGVNTPTFIFNEENMEGLANSPVDYLSNRYDGRRQSLILIGKNEDHPEVYTYGRDISLDVQGERMHSIEDKTVYHISTDGVNSIANIYNENSNNDGLFAVTSRTYRIGDLKSQSEYITVEGELYTDVYNEKGETVIKQDLSSIQELGDVMSNNNLFFAVEKNLVLALGEEGKSQFIVNDELGMRYLKEGEEYIGRDFVYISPAKSQKYLGSDQENMMRNDALLKYITEFYEQGRGDHIELGELLDITVKKIEEDPDSEFAFNVKEGLAQYLSIKATQGAYYSYYEYARVELSSFEYEDYDILVQNKNGKAVVVAEWDPDTESWVEIKEKMNYNMYLDENSATARATYGAYTEGSDFSEFSDDNLIEKWGEGAYYYSKTIELYDDLKEASPENSDKAIEYTIKTAALHFQKDNYDGAKEEFRALTAINLDSIPEDRLETMKKAKAVGFLGLAQTEFKEGNVDFSYVVNMVRQAEELDPAIVNGVKASMESSILAGIKNQVMKDTSGTTDALYKKMGLDDDGVNVAGQIFFNTGRLLFQNREELLDTHDRLVKTFSEQSVGLMIMKDAISKGVIEGVNDDGTPITISDFTNSEKRKQIITAALTRTDAEGNEIPPTDKEVTQYSYSVNQALKNNDVQRLIDMEQGGSLERFGFESGKSYLEGQGLDYTWKDMVLGEVNLVNFASILAPGASSISAGSLTLAGSAGSSTLIGTSGSMAFHV